MSIASGLMTDRYKHMAQGIAISPQAKPWDAAVGVIIRWDWQKVLQVWMMCMSIRG